MFSRKINYKLPFSFHSYVSLPEANLFRYCLWDCQLESLPQRGQTCGGWYQSYAGAAWNTGLGGPWDGDTVINIKEKSLESSRKYPLAMENDHAINGKTHELSMAIFKSCFDRTRGYRFLSAKWTIWPAILTRLLWFTVNYRCFKQILQYSATFPESIMHIVYVCKNPVNFWAIAPPCSPIFIR